MPNLNLQEGLQENLCNKFWKITKPNQLYKAIAEKPLTTEAIEELLDSDTIKEIRMTDSYTSYITALGDYKYNLKITFEHRTKSGKIDKDKISKDFIHELTHAFYAAADSSIIFNSEVENILEETAQEFYDNNANFVNDLINKIFYVKVFGKEHKYFKKFLPKE